LTARRIPRPALVTAVVLAVGAALLGVLIGPAALRPDRVIAELLDRLPWVSIESGLSERQTAILFELRLPRVVLGLLVGAVLSVSGGAYQGVFRNPLADPYLLGVAAGAGLGATLVIVTVGSSSALVGVAAFLGALAAVAVAYGLGAAAGGRRTGSTLILAGVAVAAFLTAAQTFVQQRNTDIIREVYSWILGRLGTVGWREVALMAPYAAISITVVLLHRRLLDVLAVGEEEARTLGVRPERVRLIVVLAATLSDDHLFFAVAASEIWVFDFTLFIVSAAAPDIRIALDVPAGATLKWAIIHEMDNNEVATLSVVTTGDDTSRIYGATASQTMIVVRGIIVNGGTAGNVQLRWAQGTSAGTGTTVKENSFLMAHKLA